uniref:MARVEL domain-containing protein n=2 Tax=Amblyomma TaxID=6942 RepID=G3MSC0_AMBMU
MGLPRLDVWFAGTDDELPSFSFALSLSFLNSPSGVLTVAEIVTGILTFALAYSSRVYVYQLSKLVVRVEPEPSIIYVIFVSFLYWFVSLLVLASALLSNTGINVTSTFFYVLLEAFGFVFYLSGGISLLALEASQSVATAAGVFSIISAVLHGLHALLVYLKKKK